MKINETNKTPDQKWAELSDKDKDEILKEVVALQKQVKELIDRFPAHFNIILASDLGSEGYKDEGCYLSGNMSVNYSIKVSELFFMHSELAKTTASN